MISCINFLKVVLLLLPLTILLQSSVAKEYSSTRAPFLETVPWNELVFHGSKFLRNITIKIQFNPEGQSPPSPTTAFENKLGHCSGSKGGANLLSIQSFAESGGRMQEQFIERIWFNKRSIRPIKRVRLNYNGTPWGKKYCWEENGVRRQKISSPGNPNENNLAHEGTKRTESFYTYPEGSSACKTISDPLLIFYLLSTLEPERQQQPFEICVFGKKKLHRVSITPEETLQLKVSYKPLASSQKTSLEKVITVISYSLTTEPVVLSNKKSENFNLLGLNKDIYIYMDKKRRIPVKITGKNNSVGKITLDLKTYSLGKEALNKL